MSDDHLINSIVEDIVNCKRSDVVEYIRIDYEENTYAITINEKFVLNVLKNIYGIKFLNYKKFVNIIDILREYYFQNLIGHGRKMYDESDPLAITEEKYHEYFTK